jgi:hypothetical protein
VSLVLLAESPPPAWIELSNRPTELKALLIDARPATIIVSLLNRRHTVPGLEALMFGRQGEPIQRKLPFTRGAYGFTEQEFLPLD